MAERLRVEAPEGLPAATAGRRSAGNGFIGRQQGTAVEFVSGLSAPLAAGRFPRGRALDRRRISGGGPGGVLRVLAEASGEIGHLLAQGGDFPLEVAEDGKE